MFILVLVELPLKPEVAPVIRDEELGAPMVSGLKVKTEVA